MENRWKIGDNMQQLVSHRHWGDFQDVAREYGLDFVYVEVEQGYMLLNDTDIAGDILWAIGVMDSNEDTEIIESDIDWPNMHNEKITLLCH